MTSAIGALDKGARRRQLRLVRRADASESRAQNSARDRAVVGDGAIASMKGTAGEDSEFVQLYRSTFAELVRVIERSDLTDRSSFFQAMRFLQLLGLSSDQVADHIGYAQENICRWMNGQRAPHPELRRYFIDKCIAVLRRDVEASLLPAKFANGPPR